MYESEYGMSDSGESDASLRQGLRSLATPEVSADFDAKVLARLSRREPLWMQALLFAKNLRPAFGAFAITVPVALALISWAGQVPGQPFASHFVPVQAAQALPSDKSLDSPDLSPATLRHLSREEAAARGRSGNTTRRSHTA